MNIGAASECDKIMCAAAAMRPVATHCCSHLFKMCSVALCWCAAERQREGVMTATVVTWIVLPAGALICVVALITMLTERLRCRRRRGGARTAATLEDTTEDAACLLCCRPPGHKSQRPTDRYQQSAVTGTDSENAVRSQQQQQQQQPAGAVWCTL